jgi:hypothetical protein
MMLPGDWEDRSGCEEQFWGTLAMNALTRFGLNGATGEYLPVPSGQYLADLATHQPPGRTHFADVQARLSATTGDHLGVVDAVGDASDLAQAGWGVIFAADVSSEARASLADLLQLRREMATRNKPSFHREYEFYPGETKQSFFRDRGIAVTAGADPEQMPYYLLLVGDPESIPYSFQYQLDVQYAVGRICFDTPAEYAAYARGVLDAQPRSDRQRRVAFFAPAHADDVPTNLSSRYLALPLAELIGARTGASEHDTRWQVDALGPDGSTKERLLQVLSGELAAGLLFTAGHGLAFPSGHPLQRDHQGGLVSQEWPGPAWHTELPRDFYVSASDISDDMRPTGLVAFHFACYSAGTPLLDDYPQLTRDGALSVSAIGTRRAQPIAPSPFVARLPQRLLGHPRGGARRYGAIQPAVCRTCSRVERHDSSSGAGRP